MSCHVWVDVFEVNHFRRNPWVAFIKRLAIILVECGALTLKNLFLKPASTFEIRHTHPNNDPKTVCFHFVNTK
jgi:hypothetical protein